MEVSAGTGFRSVSVVWPGIGFAGCFGLAGRRVWARCGRWGVRPGVGQAGAVSRAVIRIRL